MTVKDFVDSYLKELEIFYKHYVKIGNKYRTKYEKVFKQYGQNDATDSQMIDAIFEYDSGGLERLLKYNYLEDQYYDRENNRTAFATVLYTMNEGNKKTKKSLLNRDLVAIKLRITSMIPYIQEVLEFRQIKSTEEIGKDSSFRSQIRESAKEKNDKELNNRTMTNNRIIKAIHVGKTVSEIAQIMKEGEYDSLIIRTALEKEGIKIFERAERRAKMQKIRDVSALIKRGSIDEALKLLNDSELDFFISRIKSAYKIQGDDYSRLPKTLRDFMKKSQSIRQIEK